MYRNKHLMILAATCIIAVSSFAQSDLSKWQIGVNGGMLVYQGDLSPSPVGSYKTVKPVFGINISRVLTPSLLLRTNLAFGKLYGNDSLYSPEWRKQRSFSFITPITEFSELLVWNIACNNSNEVGLRFSPYVFAGMGLNFINVTRNYGNFNGHYFENSPNILAGLGTDTAVSTPKAVFVLPVGIGFEYYLSPKLSLAAEVNFRYTFNDYIDGFSHAANPNKNDFYYSNTIGLIYKFGKRSKLDCPVIKK